MHFSCCVGVGDNRGEILDYMLSRWFWLSAQAVLSFDERLRRVRYSLRKENKAHALTRAKLEL